MNPEYGERMGKNADLERVYRQIGDFLKQKCRGIGAMSSPAMQILQRRSGFDQQETALLQWSDRMQVA